MESNSSGWLDNAESILDQLLKFTAQLAECGNDPQVDARALADACAMRLEELKQAIPQEQKNVLAAKTQVLGKMRDLYTRTQACLEILDRKSNRAAAELQSLSRAKQAITAYNTRQGRRG
jgi:hypothetical protein